MKHDNSPTTHLPQNSHNKRADRLRKRLREINAKGEKELAAIFDTIEKAKAAFRIHKP